MPAPGIYAFDTSPHRNTPPGCPHGGRPLALIIDDEPAIARLIALELSGHGIRTAAALHRVGRTRGMRRGAARYRLARPDPARRLGIETLPRIKRAVAAPVLVITAWVSDQLRAQAMRAGRRRPCDQALCARGDREPRPVPPPSRRTTRAGDVARRRTPDRPGAAACLLASSADRSEPYRVAVAAPAREPPGRRRPQPRSPGERLGA